MAKLPNFVDFDDQSTMIEAESRIILCQERPDFIRVFCSGGRENPRGGYHSAIFLGETQDAAYFDFGNDHDGVGGIVSFPIRNLTVHERYVPRVRYSD